MFVPNSRKLTLAVLLLLGLCSSGCTTIAPHGLSAADTASFRVTSIDVSAQSASIRWTAAEDEYLRSRNLSQTDPALVQTPEARNHIADLAARRLKAALERRLAARATGTRPVRIVAAIRSASVPSKAELVLIGGRPSIDADIDIVDAQSGTVLTRYADGGGSGYAGSGLGGVIVDSALVAGGGADDHFDRAANNYAGRFADWLSGT